MSAWDIGTPKGCPRAAPAKAAGGLLEGVARDWAVNGAVFLSLVVVVGRASSPGARPNVVIGLVIGITGIGLPWVAVGRRWPITRTWVTVFAVIVADAIALAVMLV